MKKRLDYTGKSIFVGIDVHKKTYSIAIICDGDLVKRNSMIASPNRLIAYFRKHFSGAYIKSAYEAGFSGFYLHRHLLANGVENSVVHAAAIEVSSRNRVKTDKRDATKIAVQLSTNRLKGIYVPTVDAEDRRELTRLRESFVKEKNRIACKLKHKANYYGLVGAEDIKRVSSQWIKLLLEKEMRPGLRYHIETLAEQWTILHKKIQEIDKKLIVQAESDEIHERIYRSAQGIGPVAARTLANELGDMSQFLSERALFSYTGLTPSEHSSGEYKRQGHISRQGRPILRKTLVQCSWIAIRHDKSLQKIYDRITMRAGAKRAIIAVARRFIGRLRSCFRQGVLYCSDYSLSNKKQTA